MDKENQRYASLLQNEIDEKTALNEEYLSTLEELKATTEQNILEHKQRVLAEEEAQFKDNFLSNMSHEIRTPMNGIIGMLDILNETNPTPKQKDYINTIKGSSNHLLSIINDILDLSKIQAGKMTLKEEPFNIHNVVHSSKTLYEGMAKESGIEIESEYIGKIPKTLISDKTKVTQVLNNLLSNALKFTEKGKVIIRSEITSNGKFKISVIDTGIGIKKEDLEILFDKFKQIDSSIKKNYKGTGLGLSICLEIAKMLNGSIEVESEFGKGTTFSFLFDFKEGNDDTIEIIKSLNDFKDLNLNILLVEDILVNQKVAQLMLQNLNCTVEIANNGEKAVNAFEEGKYDFILMDIQMPVMDGITATQIIKEKYSNVPPIIGLSANAMEGDAEKFIAQGLDDYIAKPITKKALEAKLNEYFT